MKRIQVMSVSFFLLLGLAGSSWAGVELKIDDDTKATIGFKTQIWVQRAEDAAPSQSDPSTDISIRAFRLYTNGQVTPRVKFSSNIDWSKGDWDGSVGRAGTATVRDASITFDLAPEAQVLAGLYRTPFSRTGLQDSYQFLLPHSPEVAKASYLGDTGDFRNAGLTLWGVLGGTVTYAVGAFDGNLNPIGATTSEDDLFYSGRVAFSPLDAEKGYTNAGTYLGKKQVLTVGAGYLLGKYSIETDAPTYSAWTVDAFTEFSIAGGALTAEGAWFNYDRGVDNGKTDGHYVTVAYLFPGRRLQPVVRYESSDRQGSITGGEDFTKWTAGVNWFIKGNDAKISLEYAGKNYEHEGSKPRVDKDFGDATLALQLQF